MFRFPLRAPVVRLLVGVAVPLLLAGCSGGSGSTPPPSGACVVADASNAVDLSAKDLKFSAPCIEAAAGARIVIRFTNEESMPHNVAVYADSTRAQELVRGEIITGPNATTTVTVPPRPAGQLYFECSVHGSMNGALVVRAAPGASSGGS
ncbi:MAG: cupredoxin domain-containing protein [Chloroflexota bacterium]|nr:cupredoxin domain-containing protein [Chloroflexota bacterium]